MQYEGLKPPIEIELADYKFDFSTPPPAGPRKVNASSTPKPQKRRKNPEVHKIFIDSIGVIITIEGMSL